VPRLALLAFASLPLGCAAAAEEQPRVRPQLAGLAPIEERPAVAEDDSPPRAPSRVLALSRKETVLIGPPAPPPAPARPASRGRVQVSFYRADMENAFRYLADIGKFNLVLESGLTGAVTATLRDVDPYDALLSIARANRVDVRYERGIVTVSKAR